EHRSRPVRRDRAHRPLQVVVRTPRRQPRCGRSRVPRALQPYGLGQRLTVLERLRAVVAVRLDQMPHRLRLIRKLLAATGETHQPESRGPLPLGGHRRRWHTASSAWRDGAATRNRCMGSSLRCREGLMAVATCGRGTQHSRHLGTMIARTAYRRPCQNTGLTVLRTATNTPLTADPSVLACGPDSPVSLNVSELVGGRSWWTWERGGLAAARFLARAGCGNGDKRLGASPSVDGRHMAIHGAERASLTWRSCPSRVRLISASGAVR